LLPEKFSSLRSWPNEQLYDSEFTNYFRLDNVVY
jgi:hypothetical protein